MDECTIITCEGRKLSIDKEQLKTGIHAPDFLVIDTESQNRSLQHFKGKVKVISTVPSIDASCFNNQIDKMNELAEKYTDVAFISISKDLPFALRRYCNENKIDKVIALSDHRLMSFGNGYKIVIDQLKLLATSMIVIDKDDIIRYINVYPEVTQAPDFETIENVLKDLL